MQCSKPMPLEERSRLNAEKQRPSSKSRETGKKNGERDSAASRGSCLLRSRPYGAGACARNPCGAARRPTPCKAEPKLHSVETYLMKLRHVGGQKATAWKRSWFVSATAPKTGESMITNDSKGPHWFSDVSLVWKTPEAQYADADRPARLSDRCRETSRRGARAIRAAPKLCCRVASDVPAWGDRPYVHRQQRRIRGDKS